MAPSLDADGIANNIDRLDGVGLGKDSVYSFIQGNIVFMLIFAGLSIVDGMIVFVVLITP